MSNSRNLADLLDANGDVKVTAFDNIVTEVSTDATPVLGGNLDTSTFTVDGVDISTRDGVLTSTTSTANAALPKAGGALTGAVTTTSTFDGRDVATDGSKLDGIEASADVTDTANVTAAGALMDSELASIAAVKATTGTFLTADQTKLDGIEASADVTDTANVTASGALMDSEVTNLAQVKAFDTTDYATSTQGTTADNALPKAGGTITGDLAIDGDTTLAAYNNTAAITGNAVDVFIYDTSNDSDGGAWRKRTQHTSWYNETLNTSTRGSRKDFPSVAVIVADDANNKITIYDGDTPDLDMWMVQTSYTSAINAVEMLNGQLVIGDFPRMCLANFISEKVFYLENAYAYYSSQGDTVVSGTTLGSGIAVDTTNSQRLVGQEVNDVAMTVLPNAPIDSTTGLPIPTIAVATNGGVSVIKDDGNVWDITGSNASYTASKYCSFTKNNTLLLAQGSSSIPDTWIYGFKDLPNADTVITVNSKIGSTVNADYMYDGRNPIYGEDLSLLGPVGGASSDIMVDNNNFGTIYGLTRLKENTTTAANGSVAYINSNYNSGYMTGDIKGAWLADTDTTNVVGTNLISSNAASDDTDSTSDFSSRNGATFSVNTNSTYVSSGTRSLFVNCTNAASGVKYWKTDGGLTVGKTYVISGKFIASNGSSSNKVQFYAGGYDGSSAYGSYDDYCSVANVWNSFSMTFVAVTTNLSVVFTEQGSANNTDFYIDEFSVKLADTDRSVNANGLQVNGTITKSPVATGAELVAYSGFSSSNYLEQPYNADLDFGTGDFSVMGWVKSSTAGYVFYRNDSEGATPIFDIYYSGTTVRYRVGSTLNTDITYSVSGWTFICFTRTSGSLGMYINGSLRESAVDNTSLTNVGAVTMFGRRHGGGAELTGGSLALWRISATAPTAAQIKEIYEAEKPLFQENGKCVLHGTSDAVTALAYDDSNEELVVATSGGLSVFKGLSRVDEEDGNFTEVSQQGGMRITEKA